MMIHFLSAVHTHVIRKIHRIFAELNQWYFFRNASPYHRRRNVIAGRKHARRACTYCTLRAVKLNPRDSRWINYRPLGFISRRNLRAVFGGAAAGKRKQARVPPAGHRAARRARSLIPKDRLERVCMCACVNICV